MKAVVLLATVVVVGCATPYQSKEANIFSSRGYSHTQLSEDTFDVYFESYQREEERARDFVLLRTAELCLSHQFTRFTVLEQSRRFPSNTGSVTPTVAVGGRYGNVTPVIATSANSDGRSNVRNRVQCLNGEGQATSEVYDASYVKASVAQKYHLTL
ncbi:MAG: hypothetical protein R3F41_06595 [Gammaproteobacteria bacterium]|nr:hypothetical protein [Pseudomonadales bacterium]MCP5348585.1 hypothetical protein [Pseudomonadales bacterium]